jgi:hypothetical protein
LLTLPGVFQLSPSLLLGLLLVIPPLATESLLRLLHLLSKTLLPGVFHLCLLVTPPLAAVSLLGLLLLLVMPPLAAESLLGLLPLLTGTLLRLLKIA